MARKTQWRVLGGIFSAMLISTSPAVAQDGLGGSIGLYSDSGYSTWSTGEFGETNWNEDGYQFSGS